jgi:hypothetical protein
MFILAAQLILKFRYESTYELLVRNDMEVSVLTFIIQNVLFMIRNNRIVLIKLDLFCFIVLFAWLF